MMRSAASLRGAEGDEAISATHAFVGRDCFAALAMTGSGDTIVMIPNAWTGFDFGLGDDVERLRDTVRGFAQDEIAPRAEEIDRSNTFPRDLWPRMGSLGLHGIT